MRQIRMLPRHTKVHFEMASYTEEKLLKDLRDFIIPYVDSLGMNEQVVVQMY